jgi:DNA-binding Lrp family transcriptional regulator
MARRAFILINVSSDGLDEGISSSVAVNNILLSVSKIDGVALAQSVTGLYDIIGMIEADSLEEIGDIVTREIASIAGIEGWKVCIGTRAPVGRLANNLVPIDD